MATRRPTIIDIAKKADVSFKTVSRVLNDNPRVAAELRTRVLKAMADLDYRPNLAARSLAGRRGYAIALLVDHAEFLRDGGANAYFAPYLVDLQAGALMACRDAGYHFFVEPYDTRSGNFPNDLRAQLSKLALDGVIIAPPTADRTALLDALEEWGTPYVRIAPGIEPDRAPSVAIDEYAATIAVAEHLLALGHRHIGFVSGPVDHIAAGVRLVAFRDAIAGKAEAIVEAGDFTFAGGFAAGEALLRGPEPPTAIFAANDFMGAGVVAAATRLGLRVPQDLSVAGFDDSAAAHFTWPPLTTVHQPIRAMAQAAVELLVARAAGRTDRPSHSVLPFTLIERASTAAAP